MKMLSLDDAIKAVTMLLDDEDDLDKIWSCDVINNLQNAPSLTDVAVRRGRWNDSIDGITPFCSECGSSHRLMIRTPNYCPNCGALMTGGENNAAD